MDVSDRGRADPRGVGASAVKSHTSALIQGTLIGLLQRYLMENAERVIAIEQVEQPVVDGLYQPYFVIHMGSGKKIKVSVEEEGWPDGQGDGD